MDKTDNNSAPREKRTWLKIIKWSVGIFLSLVVLLFLVVGVAVWILTPQRLTPLVERVATEFIDGEVKVKRVELTYWSTFPRLLLDIDSLTVISHSMRDLTSQETESLPGGADTLLSLRGFHGGINLLELLRARIALNDVVIDRPAVMLVDVRPGVSNYNIFPRSDEPSDTSAVSVPDISFSRFLIEGPTPVRYVSLSDSIDVAMTLEKTSLDGDGAPSYALSMGAGADARVGDMRLDGLRMGLGGELLWCHKHPYRVELDRFQGGINNVILEATGVVDFERQLTVESLAMELPRVKVNELINLIPSDMRGPLSSVTNNLEIAMTVLLTEPYVPALRPVPSFDFTVNVPQGKLSYQQLSLEALALDLGGHVDGADVDRSRVNLKRLYASGEGVAFTLTGEATNLLTDPDVKGRFEGGVNFAKIPSDLTQFLNMTVSGTLNANADFSLRQSYLTRENFHKIKLKGDATLREFRCSMPMEEVSLYTRLAELKLGTSDSFIRGTSRADSLLTASLKVDTVAFMMPGLDARGSSLRIGGGMRNVAQSADTTLVTPIGLVMSIGRMNLVQTDDSTRLRLRDIKARASIRRFRDMARVPQMTLNIDAGRIRYADRVNRATLRNATVAMTVNPAPPRLTRRQRTVIDSLRRVYPTLAPDSIFRMANRISPRRSGAQRQRAVGTQGDTSGVERVDFGVDDETRSLLRKWNARGSIKAERVRVLTPYFPLRNVMTGFDMDFNNDSLNIHSTRLKAGHSDFTVDGTISNITRALTSRSGRQPLRINFRVTSDTIDVNQLAEAAFAGAAFAERMRNDSTSTSIVDSDDDEAVQRSITAADDAEAGPLLIPVNVEATLRLNARNVVYGDFLFHQLRGSAEVFDGALNLRNLSARTEAGGVDLTALYQGLDPNDLSFAFGMQVRDFHVGRFMQLIPSLDSIMPLMQDLDGIINGEVAATSALDRSMNLRIPTLSAAVSLEGDSLVLLDAETFRKIGKWLLFKNRDRNVIEHMSVKIVVQDSKMELYPFIFDMDRYRLGVFGSNDLDLNFKYHVAVLKSPIPFRFGINVSGNPDKMRIRLGGAKLNENTIGQTVALSDTTRINLVNQIENIFRRGVSQARRSGNGLRFNPAGGQPLSPSLDDSPADTISSADSLIFIQEGLLPPPIPAQ